MINNLLNKDKALNSGQPNSNIQTHFKMIPALNRMTAAERDNMLQTAILPMKGLHTDHSQVH